MRGKKNVRYLFSFYYTDFCTEWPSALNNDEKCEQHFPVEIETVDYVSAGTSIRNPKARVVTLRVSSTVVNTNLCFKKPNAWLSFQKHLQVWYFVREYGK